MSRTLWFFTVGLALFSGCGSPCDQPRGVYATIGLHDLDTMPEQVPVGADGVVELSFAVQGVDAAAWGPRVGIDRQEVDGMLHQGEGYGIWPEYRLALNFEGANWTCNPETRWWELWDARLEIPTWSGDGEVPALVYLGGGITEGLENHDRTGVGTYEYAVPTTLVPADTTALDGTR